MFRPALTLAITAILPPLVALPVSAQDDGKPSEPSTASEALQSLEADARAAQKAFYEERKKLMESGDMSKPIPMRPPMGPLVERALGHAESFVGTDDAVPFLMFALRHASDPNTGPGIARKLLTDYAASPALSSFGPWLPRLDRMIPAEKERADLLANLEEVTPSDAVRGWSMLTRLGDTLDTADIESDEFVRAKAVLSVITKKAADDYLTSEFNGKVALRERVGVGCTAPEIANADIDGVEFKLSDHKGKIIFLDFWGDW